MYQYKKIITMSVCVFSCFIFLSCSGSSSDHGNPPVVNPPSNDINLKQAVGYINENKTDLNKNYPHFYVTNLLSEQEVQVSLYEDSSCSSKQVSDSQKAKGITTLKLNTPLTDDSVRSCYKPTSFNSWSRNFYIIPSRFF